MKRYILTQKKAFAAMCFTALLFNTVSLFSTLFQQNLIDCVTAQDIDFIGICALRLIGCGVLEAAVLDRKSTRLNSSHMA